MIFESIINTNLNKNSQLQINCIDEFKKIFILHDIKNIIIDNYFFYGVRGKFEDILNYTLNFSFYYSGYYFEFFLSYDQLEYYITQDNKIIKECNLEDFWEEKIHLEKFINYLKRDLKTLNIPFNGTL